MQRWGWACFILVGLSSCAAEAVPGNEPSDVSASPIANAESEDCLKPPWLPAKLPAHVQASQCKQDERTFRFTLGGGAPASDDAENTFLDDYREDFHAVDGIVSSGHGFCCGEDVKEGPPPNSLCIVFGLRLCSTSLSEFVNLVRELHANDDALANRSLRISVSLEGLTGPRCEQGDADCGPVAYTERNQNPPPEERRPVDPPVSESEACSYDGECVVNGCGNGCDHWSLGGMAGTCPFIGKYEKAYCGCVENRCGWFQ